MKQVVAIGDIHGCYDTLIALITKIKAQFPDAQIVSCGDLVDRGPKSRQVVQYMINNNIDCVKGNHEQMMYTDLDETTEYPGTWDMNGGRETRASYQHDEELMQKHANWMAKLPHYIEFPEVKNENGDMLVVSHSSIQGFWKDRDLQADNIMWNREPVSEAAGHHQGIFNVFGHTPIKNGPQIGQFHANIDTGCVFNRSGYNKLTALAFPSMTVIQQENIEE